MSNAKTRTGIRVSMMDDVQYENYRCMLKRKEQRMRRFVLFVAILIVVSAGWILLTGFTSHAETEDTVVYYKYYTSYYVQNGDALWDLAESYLDDGGHYTNATWVKEVIAMNSLTRDGSIKVGQHLSLPYYSTEYKCGF
jgi:hypothetical protein